MRVCVHLCACVRVGNPWRVASACMVEGHGVEARSNQPFAQDPGMSLCDSMNGPHVLVCVRVRGVFQKKTKQKNSMYMYQELLILLSSFKYHLT